MVEAPSLLNEPINDISFTDEQLGAYFKKALPGLVKMLVTRSYCYGALTSLNKYSFAENRNWGELIESYSNFVKNNWRREEDSYIIGAGIYNQAFDFATKSIGANSFNTVLESFEKMIPKTKDLEVWSVSEFNHPCLQIK